VTADAYYNNSTAKNTDCIADSSFGSIQLQATNGVGIGPVYDQVCWNGNGGPPGASQYCNGAYIQTSASCGLNTGEPPASCTGAPYEGNQLLRLGDPQRLFDPTSMARTPTYPYGSSYNSGSNNVDFSIMGLSYIPYTTNFTAPQTNYPPIAGVPAAGAVVTADDNLSIPTTAYLTGSPPHADFRLTHVATSTTANWPEWRVFIASGSYILETDSVTIPNSGSVVAFPSNTTILNQSNAYGFIAGFVTDSLGNPISPNIQVSAGGVTAYADQTKGGRYFVQVPPGHVDVTANPLGASLNSDYVSVSSLAVPISLGQIWDGVNFMLPQGGCISGWVTRDGVNGLQGIPISVQNADGYTSDTEISGAGGSFTTIDIDTGVYTVIPQLDPLEISSPTQVTVTLAEGQNVFAATFTITGALGTVVGNVTQSGSPITTGVLIVITTNTLSGTPPTPPALSSNTLTSSPYYVGSSQENGTFSLGVRQSTSPAYNIYGYYTTISPTGAVTTTSQEKTNVQVLSGQTTGPFLLAW